MSAADTSSSQNDALSSDGELRCSIYEYEVADWFSHYEQRKDNPQFIERLNFKLSLLNVESVWDIVKVDGNEVLGVYSVKRRLNFLPLEETPSNWSITIDLSDMIAAGKDVENKRDTRFNCPVHEFKRLTATNETPFVEFEYLIEEIEKVPIFTKYNCDFYCEMNFSVISCTGLESYLATSIDFTSSFDGSNVILLWKDEQQLYFVFELLAVNSIMFYDKWMERDFFEMNLEGTHYYIHMGDTDIRGLIPILKMIAYKRSYSTCLETVAMVAKTLKFEMILAACEDAFINKIQKFEQTPKYNHIAQIYDMTQLQNVILLKTDELVEKTNSLDAQMAQLTGAAPEPVQFKPSSQYLEHITAEKFTLPEIMTVFSNSGPIPLNFAVDNHRSLNGTIRAFLNWSISWKHLDTGTVTLTIGPKFAINKVEQKSFNSVNWSVQASFRLSFNGHETRFNGFFNPRSKKATYTIERNLEDVQNVQFPFTIKTEIKSVRGLRYFVNDWRLRSFEERTPTSDIVLLCKDKKLFANLTILSFCSKFFKAMMDHSDMRTEMDEEEDLPSVNMTDISFVIVLWILHYCYSIHRSPIEAVQMEHIVPVADRFLFVDLLHKCEQELINAWNFPLGLRTLDFAIQYRLYALKDAYLKHFKTTGDIQKLKEDPSYKTLSGAAKILLCERVMELPVGV